MKKFGTPIGAGPGSDSEKVGFEVLGTPLPEGSCELGAVVFFFFFFFLTLLLWVVLPGDCFDGPPPWLEDFSGEDEVGWGVVPVEVLVVFVGVLECEGEVEVELELEELDEVPVDDEEELLEELDDVVELVVVVVVVELEAVAHAIDSVATTPLTGRFSDEIGVPGGTSTLNVSVTPPTSVTVTVQASAEAMGTSAVARTASTAAAAATIARSLRPMFTVVRPVLPASLYASLVRPLSAVSRGRTARY
jgi:hypothetical protein